MNKKKLLNPYANLTLRRQLFMEARAMAEFALSKGKKIPLKVVQIIEGFEDEFKNEAALKVGEADPETSSFDSTVVEADAPKGDIELLVATHDILADLLIPATPKTILLLDIEQEMGGLLRFLGPVGLVRKMMLVAIVSIAIFIILPSTGAVDPITGVGFFKGGTKMATSLLFYLSAAALGASFSALYTANTFITDGTFDPTHSASYWIRFMLGLISGLILSIFISGNAVSENGSLLNPELTGPLLALLGGFSAELFFTFLNRMVETMKSLFTGSAKAIIANKAQENQVKMEGMAVEGRMKLAGDLLKMQQELGKTPDPDQVLEQLNHMMIGLLPEKDAADTFNHSLESKVSSGTS